MFVFMLLLWSGAQGCTRDELQMVQIISKHGSFSPTFTYPEDPNPAHIWKEGLNDLTMLGKFESYALGVFLRNFYGDFITSDPRELEVFSSADKGVVKSAQSLVTALYTPVPYWEVVQNFSWQPIYIKYDEDDGKFLSKRVCPAADVEHRRVMIREAGALHQAYQHLMTHWSMKSGMDIKTIDDVEELFQVLHAEHAHNLTIPEWSKQHWNEMKYLHDVSITLRTRTEKLRRLLGGPLVERTIEEMREKAFNEMDPTKVVVYSSHTMPMLGFMSAMDLGKFEYLHPCTTLLAELYKHEGEYFVRYLYLNTTMPQRALPQEIFSLTVPGCVEFCPLNYIIEFTREVIPKNLEEECLLV